MGRSPSPRAVDSGELKGGREIHKPVPVVRVARAVPERRRNGRRRLDETVDKRGTNGW